MAPNRVRFSWADSGIRPLEDILDHPTEYHARDVVTTPDSGNTSEADQVANLNRAMVRVIPHLQARRVRVNDKSWPAGILPSWQ